MPNKQGVPGNTRKQNSNKGGKDLERNSIFALPNGIYNSAMVCGINGKPLSFAMCLLMPGKWSQQKHGALGPIARV